jgi:hypothetical protein
MSALDFSLRLIKHGNQKPDKSIHTSQERKELRKAGSTAFTNWYLREDS